MLTVKWSMSIWRGERPSVRFDRTVSASPLGRWRGSTGVQRVGGAIRRSAAVASAARRCPHGGDRRDDEQDHMARTRGEREPVLFGKTVGCASASRRSARRRRASLGLADLGSTSSTCAADPVEPPWGLVPRPAAARRWGIGKA